MSSVLSINEYDIASGRSSRNDCGNYTLITIDGVEMTRRRKFKGLDDVNTSNRISNPGTSKATSMLLRLKVYARDIHQTATQNLSDLFLPVGYPRSTNVGYLQYQIFDSIQGLSSYLRGVVSTSAVLTAAGVGDAEATAASAAVQWAMKDGCGMIGGLLFSYYSSSYFDSHVKEFRLFADIINDVGLCLDMICPLLDRKHVMVVSTVATLCRVMCGMAAGATKNCITQHFAKGNMADLSSKEGTQETLVSLLGMILGICLARFLQNMEETCQHLENLSVGGRSSEPLWIYKHGAFYATWFIFLYLTAIHVWANWIGVKTLKLKTLNRERLQVALGIIITRMAMLVDIMDAELDNHKMLQDYTQDNGISLILTPEGCCESLWKSWSKLVMGDNLRLGAEVSNAFEGMCTSEITMVLKLYENERYILMIKPRGLVYVCLRKEIHQTPPNANKSNQNGEKNANANDSKDDHGHRDENLCLLKSFVHALIIQQYLMKDKRLTSMYEINNVVKVLKRSKECVDILFPTVGDQLLDVLAKRGWSTHSLYLNYGKKRFEVRR